MSETRSTLTIDGRDIELTHPDKVLFPRAGCTKRDIAQYYAEVGEFMLLYIRERALTLERYPDGVREEGFVQQAAQEHFPKWIKKKKITKREGGSMVHIVGKDVATLLYLAQLGTVTVHAWLSTIDALEQPDKLLFDLDPPGAAPEDFDLVRFGAQKIHEHMSERGVAAYAMTTGAKGLHVIIPLRRGPNFDDVREVAVGIADELAARNPEKLTRELRKSKRRGRLFLDVTRNAYGQTSVAPYSLRALPGAPVATPITWEEVGDPGTHAQFQTIATMRPRLKRSGDILKDMHKKSTTLAHIRGS